VSGFPIPVMMPVLALGALLLRWRGAPHADRRGARLAIAALAWLVYRVVVLVFDGGSLGDGLALAGWYGLPMLLFLVGPAVGSVRGRPGSGWVSRLEAGMFFVCGFFAPLRTEADAPVEEPQDVALAPPVPV